MNNIESAKGATRNNITLHIGNIFKEGELDDSIVRKESLLTAADGKNTKQRRRDIACRTSEHDKIKTIREYGHNVLFH